MVTACAGLIPGVARQTRPGVHSLFTGCTCGSAKLILRPLLDLGPGPLYDNMYDSKCLCRFDSGSSWAGVLSRPGLQRPADLYLEGSDQHRGMPSGCQHNKCFGQQRWDATKQCSALVSPSACCLTRLLRHLLVCGPVMSSRDLTRDAVSVICTRQALISRQACWSKMQIVQSIGTLRPAVFIILVRCCSSPAIHKQVSVRAVSCFAYDPVYVLTYVKWCCRLVPEQSVDLCGSYWCSSIQECPDS